MNIAVYFSVLCDTDEVLKSTWEALSVGQIDLGYANRIINPYDETAIEYALRIKDAAAAAGEAVDVTLFTLGGELPAAITDNLFAVGIDRIHCIGAREFDLLHTDMQLYQVEQYLRAHPFDCLFMGQQNSYSCNSSLGVSLAARLNLPYVGYISHLQYDGGALQVKCHTAKGFQSASVSTQAVFSFENTEHPYLRIATLRERLKTRGKAPELLPLFPGTPQPQPMPEAFFYRPPLRKCQRIEGDSIASRAAQLLALFQEGVKDV